MEHDQITVIDDDVSNEKLKKALSSSDVDRIVVIPPESAMIKARYFELRNINGRIYAKFDVLTPKTHIFKGKIVDLTRISLFSKQSKNGIYVGDEQTEVNKDSLFCAQGKTRTWEHGHVGYFNFFMTLCSDDSEKIKELLDVDSDYDGCSA